MSNVADVKSKDVKITLNDGVEYSLKYDLNAMAEMEDRYGSVENAFKELEEKNSIKAVRFMLWVGMLHDHPDFTEQKVGSLIDVQSLQNLMEGVGMAFSADMPKAEQIEESPNK